VKVTGAIKFVYVVVVLWLSVACNSSITPKENRLASASSPYLQEHADNPVDWYEWGDEALQKAKDEDKPLLISIGYASCHWCHVMEKESFMDTAVARIMNENFVCIKVDREERPDIDNMYVHACQLLNNGEAGWPLNAFALPDGKPFFAGTYYPKTNWINLLKQIAESYKTKKGKVILQANSLTVGIMDNDLAYIQADGANSKIADQQLYRSFFDSLYSELDLVNGGLKGQPKFPRPSLWEFLLQYHYITGDQRALDATVKTLNKMALGGIYDHIGGGFARYSTDSLWKVPHFEKMLYDNAQLVSLYTHAYQVTKNEFYKTVAEETISLVEQELTSPEGAFYSSLNADTEEGEGEFYIWSLDEVRKVLGSNAGVIESYYGLSQKGNMPVEELGEGNGKNIFMASFLPAEFAIKNNIPVNHFNAVLIQHKKALLAERNKRVKPAVDDKILTSWNALMMEAYANAYMAFGNESYLKKALTNAGFIKKNMLAGDGRLKRNFRNGKASIDAFLDDYALLAKAWIRLYEVTFDKHWLDQSKKLADYAIAHFYDSKTGLFFYSSSKSESLAVRKMEVLDNVIPSSNAVMAEVIYKLNKYFEENDYLQKSRGMFNKIAGKIGGMASYYQQWCYLGGLFYSGTYEVAIVGKEAIAKNRELQKHYLPRCIFMGGEKEDLPLLENKLAEGRTMIYVCTNKTCKLPVEEVHKSLEQIK
jgi:uncharacterized protein YyaL (SSP411 family)